MNDVYRSQFRLPWALYEALQEQATANGTSLNTELVQRLHASFGPKIDNNELMSELKRQGQILDQLLEAKNKSKG
jgi:hypothetical protein